MTSIKLLHGSALGCHRQGVFLNKRIQAYHTNVDIASHLLE